MLCRWLRAARRALASRAVSARRPAFPGGRSGAPRPLTAGIKGWRRSELWGVGTPRRRARAGRASVPRAEGSGAAGSLRGRSEGRRLPPPACCRLGLSAPCPSSSFAGEDSLESCSERARVPSEAASPSRRSAFVSCAVSSVAKAPALNSLGLRRSQAAFLAPLLFFFPIFFFFPVCLKTLGKVFGLDIFFFNFFSFHI